MVRWWLRWVLEVTEKTYWPHMGRVARAASTGARPWPAPARLY